MLHGYRWCFFLWLLNCAVLRGETTGQKGGLNQFCMGINTCMKNVLLLAAHGGVACFSFFLHNTAAQGGVQTCNLVNFGLVPLLCVPHRCLCFHLPPPFLPAPAIATAAVCRHHCQCCRHRNRHRNRHPCSFCRHRSPLPIFHHCLYVSTFATASCFNVSTSRHCRHLHRTHILTCCCHCSAAHLSRWYLSSPPHQQFLPSAADWTHRCFASLPWAWHSSSADAHYSPCAVSAALTSSPWVSYQVMGTWIYCWCYEG